MFKCTNEARDQRGRRARALSESGRRKDEEKESGRSEKGGGQRERERERERVGEEREREERLLLSSCTPSNRPTTLPVSFTGIHAVGINFGVNIGGRRACVARILLGTVNEHLKKPTSAQPTLAPSI